MGRVLPKGEARAVEAAATTSSTTSTERKARFYYRRAGVKEVPLPGLPWSPEFMRAWEKADAAYKGPSRVVVGASRTEAGSVNAGLVAYYQSTAFKNDLGQNTQGARRNLLERFRVEHEHKRLKMLERRHVQAYIYALPKATIQRSMLQALKGFLAYCVSIKVIADNPAEGVTRAKVSIPAVSGLGPRRM